MTGEFYADSVSAESGEVWLGLFQVGDEYELRSTTLVVDESERRGMDYKEVQTDQPSNPRFLVRGLAWLLPGKVETVIPDGKFIYPGQRETFGFGRNTYALRGFGEATDRDLYSIFIEKYKLTLSATLDSPMFKYSQKLLEYNGVLEVLAPRVEWAGDLDKDGKLDLFMQMSHKSVYSEYALFLSSSARDGEIVGQVARWGASND